MEENQTLKNDISRLQDVLESLDINNLNNQLIQDNKSMFIVDDTFYRVRMPSQRDRTQAEDYKNKVYHKLIADTNALTRKQLKKRLLEKDIDIEALEQEKDSIQKEVKDLYLSLAVVENQEEDRLEQLKNDVIKKQSEVVKLSIEITQMLASSIEDRLEKEYTEYLTYLCTEQGVGETSDQWERLWPSYDAFCDDSSKLVNKAVEHLVYLLIHVNN